MSTNNGSIEEAKVAQLSGFDSGLVFHPGFSQPVAASRLLNEPIVLRLCRTCSLGPLNVVWSTKIQSGIINHKTPPSTPHLL